MRKVIVVAGGVERARVLAEELGIEGFHTSPRAIRDGGACRGLTADLILIDDTAWPLDEQVHETLASTLLGSGGQMYRLERIDAEGRP